MNDNATGSTLQPPPPTSRQDIASIIRTVNEELVYVMKENVSKEVGSLSTQLTKYHTELQENIKQTVENNARINSLEGQVAALKNQNKDYNKEMNSINFNESSYQESRINFTGLSFLALFAFCLMPCLYAAMFLSFSYY